ncbi:MAG TPA: hypothetical protein VMI30_11255 [Stellaceae bacterium]|nr:hypothetical protein [Stellaceae bacterium]
MMVSTMASFAPEQYCVEQLASSLGISSDVQIRDPKVDYRRETGIDVIMIGQGHRIGFQVTEYDGGENVARLGAGQMRREEVRQKRIAVGGVYAGWGSPHFPTAFRARIDQKIRKAENYSFCEVDEVWLLVSAGLPDAPIATFLPHFHIAADDLNDTTARLLENSKFSGAFLHVIMGNALYEWDRRSRWQKRSASDRA